MKSASSTGDFPKLAITVTERFEHDWPGASGVATEIVLNIGWLSTRMQAMGDPIVRAHGLPSLAAFNALEIVRVQGSLTASAIADRMIVRRQTMTGILDSLERRKLIQRGADLGDRRKVLVTATPEGSARSMAARRELHALERAWVSSLGPAEQQEMRRLVAKLQAGQPKPKPK